MHHRRLFAIIIVLCTAPLHAEPMHRIVVDGLFDDWSTVTEYLTPSNDTHDTDHSLPDDVPAPIDHPDVDLVAYRFTHDEANLYAYFRSVGVIGRTQQAYQGRAGRYYVIVTLDVDNNDATGYWLNEGGYYPTSPGYDMNMEVEFYDGAFNTGHYLNHGCLNDQELSAAFNDQAQGIVDIRPGTYDFYTQWVWFDTPLGLPEEIILPNGSSVVWVQDKGPVYQGIIEIALSADGHEAEMVAPFRGFMKDRDGHPIMDVGKVIDVSMSLEASGELAPGGEWASDTALPIVGYFVAPPDFDSDGDHYWDVFEVDHGANPSDAENHPAPSGVSGDVNIDGATDAVDVQLVINGALSIAVPAPTDLDADGSTTAVDVQKIINWALGIG